VPFATDQENVMADLYEGLHNLGVLQQAKNYNAHLLSIVLGSGLDARAVVDFGAGLGTFAAGCRAVGMKVACIEPDHSLRLRLDQLGFEAHNTLDHVSPESVDYIYTLNVLEHIDDDAEILIQLYKRLRPGGRLMVYVPAFPYLYSAMDKMVGHRRRYTRSGLVRLVSASGFHVDRAEYVDCLGFLATLIFKWFGNREGNVNQQGLILFDRYIFPVSLLLDRAVSRLFGKNVLVCAHRPSQQP
jgi:SAM-dependent methyltransferase